MLNRAYSLLSVKEVDNDKRIIRGMATTPEVDRVGDVIDPLGCGFKNPAPLLWMHDHSLPVGSVWFGTPTKEGVPFTAQLPEVDGPAQLKGRIDEAWTSVKAGLIRAVSIGFRALEYALIEETGGFRFLKTEILELSLVSVPANSGATISEIKSIDSAALAASGNKGAAGEDGAHAAGVSAKPAAQARTVKTTPKEGKKMNLAEQIKQFQNERAAKVAAQTAIMKKSADDGQTLGDKESEDFDQLGQEIEQIDKHLSRLNSLQKTQAAQAAAVDAAGEPSLQEKAAAVARGGQGPTIIVKKDADEKFKGQNYTRMVIAKALGFVHQMSPAIIAEKRWGRSNPTLVALIKANEVPGLASGSGEPGAELVAADNRYTGDFIEFLNAMTVFDKLGFRDVPANVAIKGQDGAATGYWIGESKAMKMSKPDFSSVSLTPLKVAAITTLSNELIQDSSPAAEQLVRDALIASTAQRIDSTLFSADAASNGVSPAGLLNGLAAINTAGNDAAGVLADIAALYAPFITAKNASGLVFVMNTSLAKALSLMRNALGQKEFPDLGSGGGTLEGDKVVTGDNVDGAHLILLKPSDIYKIGDGGIEVSVSRDATIEQSTAPTGVQDTPVAASQAMVNMFQNESTAIKVVRRINFAKRRSTAVAYVGDAAYGTPES